MFVGASTLERAARNCHRDTVCNLESAACHEVLAHERRQRGRFVKRLTRFQERSSRQCEQRGHLSSILHARYRLRKARNTNRIIKEGDHILMGAATGSRAGLETRCQLAGRR